MDGGGTKEFDCLVTDPPDSPAHSTHTSLSFRLLSVGYKKCITFPLIFTFLDIAHIMMMLVLILIIVCMYVECNILVLL